LAIFVWEVIVASETFAQAISSAAIVSTHSATVATAAAIFGQAAAVVTSVPVTAIAAETGRANGIAAEETARHREKTTADAQTISILICILV